MSSISRSAERDSYSQIFQRPVRPNVAIPAIKLETTNAAVIIVVAESRRPHFCAVSLAAQILQVSRDKVRYKMAKRGLSRKGAPHEGKPGVV